MFNLETIKYDLYSRMDNVFNGKGGLYGTKVSNAIAFYTKVYLQDFFSHITEKCPNIDIKNTDDLSKLDTELQAVLDAIHYLYSPCCKVFSKDLFPTYKEMIDSFIGFIDCDYCTNKKHIIELLIKIVNEAEKIHHEEKNVKVLSRLIDVI